MDSNIFDVLKYQNTKAHKSKQVRKTKYKIKKPLQMDEHHDGSRNKDPKSQSESRDPSVGTGTSIDQD